EGKAEVDHGQDHADQCRGGRDPDQEDARQEDFQDREQGGGGEPQPVDGDSVEEGGKAHFCPPSNGPRGGVGVPSPWLSASRASAPIPPRVPISWVASTGKRMVLLLGEVAKRLIASTYF